MNDLVSVIIPTYNRSHFVTEAVESVLNQTYPNIELIVVNDGSTDDTEEKLLPYMDRINYIPKENGGTSSAVNAGLRVARGKYIARLDDDDLFVPEKTEKQVKVFEDNPDVGLVTSGCFIVDAVGRTIAVKDAPDFSEYGAFLTLLMRDWVLFQPTVMVRRACHDKLGFYKDTFAEDFEMFIRVSRYWKLGTVKQPLAKYRRHSTNITEMIPKDKRLLQEIKAFLCDILDDVGLSELFPGIGSEHEPYSESCAYTVRGALYLHHRIYQRAEADFLKALEVCPANPIPLLWLGISARSRKKFLSAEGYFRKIKEESALYPISQNARDLITAIRKNVNEGSILLEKEKLREYRKLFRITYDGISGRSAEETPVKTPASNGLRSSRYNVIVDNYESGKHLVFNTLTHATVSIGDDLSDLLHNPHRPISQAVQKDARVLRKMGILVSPELDETETASKLYSRLKNDLSRMYIVVLTTYQCNFACKYCIEEGIKGAFYMDEVCSDHLADWVINIVEANGTKELALMFYGGEPLLNVKPIYSISEKLQRFAVDRGIILSSSITTNGSLLSSKLLQDLIRYGLKSVKVTVDGEKEVHDVRRPYKNGQGSFDTIMRNIKEIPGDVKLTIQTNLDLENAGDFPRLLDYFERSGIKDRINNMVISPVLQSLGLDSRPGVLGISCVSSSDPQMADSLIHMRKLIVERGFSTQSDGVGYGICSMNRNGNVLLIDPMGYIYNCPAFVGREGFSIGDVYHTELGRIAGLPDSQVEDCLSNCTYFPLCGGGCRYMSYMLHGDHARIFCEKESLDSHIAEMIKIRYIQKMNQMKTARST